MKTTEPVTAAGHPLDPLSAEEITKAAEIVLRDKKLGEAARFVSLSLVEGPKAAILAYKPGQPFAREVFAVIYVRGERKTYEALVSLDRDIVAGWREVPHVQPGLTVSEMRAAEAAVKKNSSWQEAMLRRGIEDLENVMVDIWPLGYHGPQDDPDQGRFARALTWVRMGGPDDNGYAHPVEGLIVRIDLDEMVVVDVEDHGTTPVPQRPGNYTADGILQPANVPSFPAGPRRDLKAIEISQPEGASFTIDGHQVEWQKWRFRIGYTAREGLVLHLVSYKDEGRERPLIYRASLSEMFIPYGDPSPSHYRKNAFDMGEYGLGGLANSLELGCDCLGQIHYFDVVVNDSRGRPLVLRNAICLHEEDYGILWKHTDFRTFKVEVRRSRRLVVSMIATVGNYEYGLFWYFYADGTIQYEIKLTGIISNGAVRDGDKPKHGVVVAPGIYGPHHQHFFCVRLDMMVDGIGNSVSECESEALPPGDDNPYGNAWIVKRRVLDRESVAQGVVSPLTARYWRIANPSRKNAIGEPVAYKLMPGDNVLPFFQPGAAAIKRAGFATKHLWVTAYDPTENFPAGDYPNQHPGGAGLPEYVKQDRPLENADVVVWYVFGAHHVARPEDWPVVPVAYSGFHLKPDGFFDGNPALDVPNPHHHGGHG
jgi:primary-amine oxidase